MQKINLRELYPDVYKTDVFVDVAEEVVAAIRGQEQDDAAYERRKFRHKAHYSLNREDGIESDALKRPLTPEEVLEQNNGLISYVQYVQNGCVYFTSAGLQEYIEKCTHRAKPAEKNATYHGWISRLML